MLDILKVVRYIVFVVFVICNAVITSVAVWNLSIVQAIALNSTSKQVDAYLIFVGVSGLILVFPILFIELFGKETFFSKVWFELSWVGLFWVLELVGASTITSQSNSNLCNNQVEETARSLDHDSPCTSAQVLQAFTWICTILLFGYFSLLSISTILRYRSDPAIFTCSVRKFPWSSLGPRQLSSTPQSPSKDKFHEDEAPRIAAPKPHRLTIPFGEAFASYRRGISQDYDIEHFQFPAQFDEKSKTPAAAPVPPAAGPSTWGTGFTPADMERHPTSFDGSTTTGPSTFLPPQPAPVPEPALMRTLAPVRSTTLYPTYVQNAVSPPPIPVLGTPTPPPAPAPGPPIVTIPVPPPRIEATPSRPSALRLLPPTQPRQAQRQAETSNDAPDPLGEWPRLDAVSRPAPTTKVKRKPLPMPNSNPQPRPPSSYAFDPMALTAALEPLASPTQPTRNRPSLSSRPTGPRIRSSSSGGAGDPQSSVQLQPQRRPLNLDLSGISNHHRS